MLEKQKKLKEKFIELFGKPEGIVRAPGRANIIGEHIDYCDGLVLPFAIGQAMYFYINRNNKKEINIVANDLGETCNISNGYTENTSMWAKFCVQVTNILKEKVGFDIGINVLFGSQIPVGGGVSSSSALCCGLLKAIDTCCELGLTPKTIVDWGSEAEHGIGLKGGKMDQSAIVYGQNGKAVYLDCESMSHSFVDVDLGEQFFMLFDTKVKHSLVDSDYNNRRSETERAIEIVGKKVRDIKTDDLNILRKREVEYKRLFHVVNEIQRVKESVQAINSSDFNTLGRLMNESHKSLSEDYNVSCAELDFIAESLNKYDQVLGARMMGGGFGGNVIALMNKELSKDEVNKLNDRYKDSFGVHFSTLKIKPSQGIEVL